MLGQTSRPGIDLYQSSDFPGAERELLLATEHLPTDAEAWRYLGFSQYGLKKYDAAAASLEKAIALQPDFAETRYGLGLVRAAQGKTDEAIACLDECLRIEPNHGAAKFALVGGLVFRSRQRIADRDFDRAESDLERATRIDRKNPAAPVALAKHFMDTGQDQRSKKVVRDALGFSGADRDLLALASQLNVQASAATAHQAQQAVSRQAVHQSQEMPCPACKRPIMHWAVQCPHCGTQIKARPTSFDHLKGGPSTNWQEVVYYIGSGLFLLDGFRPILAALVLSHAGVSGLNGILVTVGVIKICVALGLLFRVEWLQFIARIFCILDILFGGWAVMQSGMFGMWGAFAYNFLSLCLTGLMLYLIGYMDG